MMVAGESTGKTAFVLGAGFSHQAGFPLQAEILDRIRDLSALNVYGLVTEGALPEHVAQEFVDDHSTVLDFLGRTFGPQQTPTLEDVFTLLDQTIAEKTVLPGFGLRELQHIRVALDRTILFPFHHASVSIPREATEFYRQVAGHVLERRIAAGQSADPVSVVSLNWDCLLEDSIVSCVREIAGTEHIDVDYRCFTRKLTESTLHTPSQHQQARGMFNVKVAKLHGSVSWLICPLCKRLFTGLGSLETPWELYVRPRQCPSCAERWPRSTVAATADQPRLEPFIVTPTFLKVFDSAHIRAIWDSAYVDLAEATEVVFIGYSLPDADYHVRTLLRRAISPNAQVRVVLTERDEAKRNTPRHLRAYLAAERYRTFFGPERPTFIFSGVEGYFGQLTSRTSLRRRLARVRRLIGG